MTSPADAIAEPYVCTRCQARTLLTLVGRCADCIAEMGLRVPDEYAAWKQDVAAEYGRKN